MLLYSTFQSNSFRLIHVLLCVQVIMHVYNAMYILLLLKLRHFWVDSLGGRHSSVVSSAPTILRPKHTGYTFFNLYYWNCIKKITKINKKRPGLVHFFKKNISWFKSLYCHTSLYTKGYFDLPKYGPRNIASGIFLTGDSEQERTS